MKQTRNPYLPGGSTFRMENRNLLAPDAICGPDGRYYLYYFTSKMDKLGVAVCATPAGHYEYYGDVCFSDGRILTSESGYGLMFDPAIYSEEEGNFLYYGFALQKRKEGFITGLYVLCSVYS